MKISIIASLGYSVLGMAVVFAMLVVLMLMIVALSRILAMQSALKAAGSAGAAPVPAAAPAPASPAASSSPAGNVVRKVPAAGSFGEVKLHTVPDKTAALVMAIVADQLQEPLNELRFISIKQVD